MSYLINKIFTEIAIGDQAQLTHTLTQKDIELFAIMSGDINPAHVDLEYAKDDIFHGIIAHGMWGASLISTILGTKLPGAGTIYLNQNLKFSHPIILHDTVTVTVVVINKYEDKNIIELDCRCVTQANKIAISGIATVIAPTVKIKRKAIILPQLILQNKSSHWNEKLMKMQQSLIPLVTAVVHPVDQLSLEGAINSAIAGVIIPILVGPKTKILNAAAQAGIDISSYQLIDTKHSHEACQIAIELVKTLKVEALMKGSLHTDELMSAVMNKENGLRTERRISHVFALEVPNYPKPLFITDAAINLFPTLEQKADIVQNAIDLFIALGLGTPKVALISAIETVNEKIPSTLTAAALCKMAERGQIQGGILDGPLAFDNAISVAAAQVKAINSKVAGDADIIVVPDIESGNILYKQMTYLSNMEAAGIVLGARVPIILTSRGSDLLSRKLSAIMALIYQRHKEAIIIKND